MAFSFSKLSPFAYAAATMAGLTCQMACAQSAREPAAVELPAVVVSDTRSSSASVSGWSDVPLSKAPFSAQVFSSQTLRDQSVTRLSDLVRLDVAVGDSYNAVGYWDTLSMRGYTIDNKRNYRRDGLPISAETALPLGNKDSVEILKGASGIQAGVSAPGGLANLVVKRPTAQALTRVSLGLEQYGTVSASLDLSRRFGQDQAFGFRLNAEAAKLNPAQHSARGERQMLAFAGDWRISPDTLLEAEFETSHQRQPSVPGFSLLGNLGVPAMTDARINLNNQPWSLPVVFGANTASLRLTQALNDQWSWSAHAMTQHLKTDDRAAFPFGVYNPNDYSCNPCDRFNSDGTYSMWDYRSQNERRTSSAIEVNLNGKFQTAGLEHQLSLGVLHSKQKRRFQKRAYNLVGIGNVQGTLVRPSNPELTSDNTQADEKTTEFFVRDAIKLSSQWSLWTGLRHSRLSSNSINTSGNEPTQSKQNLTTPWLALSYALSADTTAYASWGQGVESIVVPNRPKYTNAGQTLPALKSRQIELGLKSAPVNAINWAVAAFDIDCPAVSEFNSTKAIDGSQHHRGIEASTAWRWGALSTQASIQWIRARREGSQDGSLNGLRPVNVPARTFKLQTQYDVPQWSGMQLQANLWGSSSRIATANNDTSIGGYAVLDTGLRYQQKRPGAQTLVWRLDVNNVFNRKDWRESPLYDDHTYLFPLQSRQLSFSVEISL